MRTALGPDILEKKASVNVQEASEVLKLSMVEVYRLIRQGDLWTFRRRGHRRITSASVKKLLQAIPMEAEGP